MRIRDAVAALAGLAAGVVLCLSSTASGGACAPTACVSSSHDSEVITRLRDELRAARDELASAHARLPGPKPPPTEAQPPQQAWEDSANNRRVHSLLSRVANDRKEVMLTLANDVMMCSNRKTCWWNGGNVLDTFLQGVTRLGVRNYVVVTLDDATEAFCQNFNKGLLPKLTGSGTSPSVPSLRLELPVPTAQQGSRGANMISTLKYSLLKQTLLMGFSVLVVDLDLVFLKDPFAHLYRDADVEASTDGFSHEWASGQMKSVHEPAMGWGAGGLYVQHFTLNVGCAFFRPTPKAIDLMQRVADKLAKAAAWDQQVFNSEVFLLSHGAYNGSKVSVRVMAHDQWMNSKVFFFSERRRFFPGKKTAPEDEPVMIHMNYHPDKHKRMLCVWERFVEGKAGACDDFPPGSK